jgi:hypothetical protein
MASPFGIGNVARISQTAVHEGNSIISGMELPFGSLRLDPRESGICYVLFFHHDVQFWSDLPQFDHLSRCHCETLKTALFDF